MSNNTKLPSLGNVTKATGKVVKERAEQLQKQVVNNLSPNKIISKGFDTIKQKIMSEIPDLGKLYSGFESFLSDIKNESNKPDKKQAKNIEQIKTDTEKQTSLFDKMIIWMQKIDSNLHGSPPYLLTISEELDMLNVELKTLTETTANAWDISQQQLELTRQILKTDKDALKQSKFQKQSSDSKLQSVNVKPDVKVEKKEKNGLFDFLQNVFLGRLLVGFGAILAPILTILGQIMVFTKLSKLAPGLTNSLLRGKTNGPNIGSNMKQTFDDSAKKPQGKFAKLGKGALGLGKGLLRATGVGIIAIAATEAIFGAVSEGIKSFAEGNSTLEIIGDMFKAAVLTPIQSFMDIFGMIFNIDMPDLMDINFSEYIGNLWEKIKISFSDGVDWIKEKFNNGINSLKEGIWNPIQLFFDSLVQNISDTFQNLKAAVINSVKGVALSVIQTIPGAEKLFSKETLAELKRVEPSAIGQKQLDTDLIQKDAPPLQQKATSTDNASQMVVGQKQLDQFEMSNKLYAGMNKSSGNTTIAPITQTNTTNNLVTSNMITRNPDSPIFSQNKIMP